MAMRVLGLTHMQLREQLIRATRQSGGEVLAVRFEADQVGELSESAWKALLARTSNSG
jgi:hypothetical protein